MDLSLLPGDEYTFHRCVGCSHILVLVAELGLAEPGLEDPGLGLGDPGLGLTEPHMSRHKHPGSLYVS